MSEAAGGSALPSAPSASALSCSEPNSVTVASVVAWPTVMCSLLRGSHLRAKYLTLRTSAMRAEVMGTLPGVVTGAALHEVRRQVGHAQRGAVAIGRALHGPLEHLDRLDLALLAQVRDFHGLAHAHHAAQHRPGHHRAHTLDREAVGATKRTAARPRTARA